MCHFFHSFANRLTHHIKENLKFQKNGEFLNGRACTQWLSTTEQQEQLEVVQFTSGLSHILMVINLISYWSRRDGSVSSSFTLIRPGQRDFNLLIKLVLPDGSIMRVKLPGRPTRDCLFSDSARDGKRYLHLYNSTHLDESSMYIWLRKSNELYYTCTVISAVFSRYGISSIAKELDGVG